MRRGSLFIDENNEIRLLHLSSSPVQIYIHGVSFSEMSREDKLNKGRIILMNDESDTDLIEIPIKAGPHDLPGGRLTLSRNNAKINVYRDKNKSVSILTTNDTYTWSNLSTIPASIWVEGITESTTDRGTELTLELADINNLTSRDVMKLTIIAAKVDIRTDFDYNLNLGYSYTDANGFEDTVGPLLFPTMRHDIFAYVAEGQSFAIISYFSFYAYKSKRNSPDSSRTLTIREKIKPNIVSKGISFLTKQHKETVEERRLKSVRNKLGKDLDIVSKEQMKNYIASMNEPIDFYGKVIDQNNNPLKDVKVLFKIRKNVFQPLALVGVGKDFERIVTETDAQGLFKLESAEGETLGFDLVKEGFRVSSKGKRRYIVSGFNMKKDFPKSSPNKPIIFTMWKKLESQALIFMITIMAYLMMVRQLFLT